MSDIALISADPDVLARWQQAFPQASAFDSAESATRARVRPASVWLHLPRDREQAAGLVAELSAALAPARLVALSDTPSDEQALELMERGAVGYCHAHAGPAMLQQVATVVANQGLWVGPNLLSRMIRASLAGMPETPPDDGRLKDLSARELEVASAVGRGSNNKEIARELDITERTVKAHLSAIFLKLGVRDRLHLALMMRNSTG